MQYSLGKSRHVESPLHMSLHLRKSSQNGWSVQESDNSILALYVTVIRSWL